MRYFYDTEFLDNGKTIDLISIGIVAEDGREYYAENRDADFEAISLHPFLAEHVVPNLDFMSHAFDNEFDSSKSYGEIAADVREFITGDRQGNELWAYYSAYDHVALAQLFGPMVNLPSHVPMFSHDLKVELVRLGLSSDDVPVQDSGHHNALADAHWNKAVFDYIREHH